MDKLGLLVWAMLPIFGMALPPDYLDSGVSKCPSILIFQTPCPFCGLSRATLHALHGQWDIAFGFNPMIAWTFPLCIIIWLFVLKKMGVLAYVHFNTKRKEYHEQN